MKLVLIGAPGSGKGTVAQKLAKNHNLKHISTGDMIRDHIKRETEIGLQVRDVLERGDLVSDEMMMSLVEATLNDEVIKAQGYILDGFPRTKAQASWFLEKFVIDHYIVFDISDACVVERISGRRIHPGSNRIYHTIYAPPQTEGKDDVTGEDLVQREDDKPEKVVRRLEVYKELTFPIIDFLEKNSDKTQHINADQEEDKVLEAVEKILQ